MRELIACLTLAVASAVAAGPAAADTMGVLAENTLMLSDSAGRTTAYLFSADGKVQQTRSDGNWAAGFWERKEGGRLCFTLRGEASVCLPMSDDHAVGDKWTVTGPTGLASFTLQILPDRIRLDGKPVSAE